MPPAVRRASNFYTAKGELATVLSYAELRDRARDAAQRLAGLGLERGSRVVLIADTDRRLRDWPSLRRNMRDCCRYPWPSRPASAVARPMWRNCVSS